MTESLELFISNNLLIVNRRAAGSDQNFEGPLFSEQQPLTVLPYLFRPPEPEHDSRDAGNKPSGAPIWLIVGKLLVNIAAAEVINMN